MTELTQTQERKLWASIRNGNEEAIKWNEVLTAFSSLGFDRQKAAIKKIPIDKFLSIKSLFDNGCEIRSKEISDFHDRTRNIRKIKALMEEQGVSMAELSSLFPASKPKAKQSNRRSNVSKADLFKKIVSLSESGIINYKAQEIANKLDIGNSTIYSRLNEYIADGDMVKLDGGGYQILSNI